MLLQKVFDLSVYKFRYYLVIFVFLLSLVFVRRGIQCHYKWLPYNTPYCLVYYISAYNFFKHNTLFSWYEKDLCWRDGLVYSKVPSNGTVVGWYPVTETIGFAIVVGLLWKLTGSPSIYHVQFLAIFLFGLSFVFLYEIVFLLFGLHSVAVMSCISMCMFFPITYTAIQGRNDIWIYFGIVLLLFIVLKYKEMPRRLLSLLGGVVIALLQWIRSPLVFPVFGVIVFLMVYGFFTKKTNKYKFLIWSIFLTNLLFFWIPFLVINKIYYGRYFVGPLGLLLLVGLGEFSNKWGVECNDSWVMSRVPFSLGTVAFDDAAKVLFLKYFKEDPFFFFVNIFRRILRLLFWNFTWFDYNPGLYGNTCTFAGKLKAIISSPILLFDFIFRTLYIRCYFALGYCGVVLALLKKRYFEVLLLVTCMWSIPIVLLSHIEDRYVVVHFWIMAFFVGYFLFYFYNKFLK